MSHQSPTTLDDLLDYANLENFIYLFSGLIIVKLAQWSYWPVRRLFSPLRHLPGPKNESLIFGNLKRVFVSPNLVVHEEWISKYGDTFAYRGFLSSYRLYTTDFQALTFVMTQTSSFPKPDNLRRGLADFLGQGLIFAESDSHKRQRRIMSPSFGPPQIRELLPVFWQKSHELKDIWIDIIKSKSDENVVINVLPWLSRATLDIIGVAGFDYHFNCLKDDDKDELSRAFRKGFESSQNITVLGILQTFLPIVRYIIPDERRQGLAESATIMRRIGTKLIGEKKAALDQELKPGSTTQGRDLLTLLIKSNLALENEGQRMTDEEVLAQISTFLVAGHETTSTATTWALYALTKHPQAQHKLRQELLEAGLGDEPSMAELDKLVYLDNVVHESLRIYPSVPATIREAANETHIPVSRPYQDRKGTSHNFIKISKGDGLIIPILAMNRHKEIWGEDSMEFRPERWDNLPEAAKSMPGVWGHLMTFIHGNRSCIGYRFAVLEMKALVYTLVRAIEFDIGPNIEAESKSLSARPLIKSEHQKGNQMPLICKIVNPT